MTAQKTRLPMRPVPLRGRPKLRGVVASVILTAGLTVSLTAASASTPQHHAPGAHGKVRCSRVAHPKKHSKCAHSARSVAPPVTITSGPVSGSVSGSAAAAFAFKTSSASSSFRCALDGARLSVCASPIAYAGLSAGSHSFRVLAVTSGASSKAVSVTWTVNQSVSGLDTTPPTTPTGLVATPGDTQVALTWNASTDDVAVAGYRVYRNGGQVAQTSATTLTDTGLTDGTVYSYTVIALDTSGNVSTVSGAVSVTPVASTGQGTPPSTPAGLAANPGDTQVALSWSASTDPVGVAGYRVYRNGSQVAQTTATTSTDTGLADGTTYSYTVTAVDTAGRVSAASGAVAATPVAPTHTGPQPDVFDGRAVTAGAITYNPGTPLTSGNSNQWAQVPAPFGLLESGLGVAGSSTPLNVGPGADPRISMVTDPTAGGRSGLSYKLTVYDGDHAAGSGLSVGNLNPATGSHFGSAASMNSRGLITPSANNDIYIGFSFMLPGSAAPAGINPYPSFHVNSGSTDSLIYETYGPPYSGTPPVALEINALSAGGPDSLYWANPNPPYTPYWRSASLPSDTWIDVIIHQHFATTAGWPGAGYTELWLGVGGSTFAANITQQTFTGGSLANGNKALQLITAGPANWNGSTPNTMNFSSYYRAIGNYVGAGVDPVTMYLDNMMAATTLQKLTG